MAGDSTAHTLVNDDGGDSCVDENDNVLVVIIVAVGDKMFDMVTVDNVD